MLKNSFSGKDSKRPKRKSRPKYLSHPAFIALVILNIGAGLYGAFLWFNENDSPFNKESASVKVLNKSSKPANSEKTKKPTNNPFAKTTTASSPSLNKPAVRPPVAAMVEASLHKSVLREQLMLPEQNVKKDTLLKEPESSTSETLISSAVVKKDSLRKDSAISTTQPLTPSPIAKKEKIEIVSAPSTPTSVSSPPVLEVPAELVSHNASPGKAKPLIKSENKSSRARRTYYTVAKGEAHFHNLPDPSTRRKAFINHWNKAILKPIDDKDGFIYIVYANQWGKTSRGWLAKKDLQPLK